MNSINMETKQQTFAQVMMSLGRRDRTEMEYQLAKSCLVRPLSIRNWISGHRTPAPLAQKEIAKILKRPIDELFPPKQHQKNDDDN